MVPLLFVVPVQVHRGSSVTVLERMVAKEAPLEPRKEGPDESIQKAVLSRIRLPRYQFALDQGFRFSVQVKTEIT